jgi:hypothetical protein
MAVNSADNHGQSTGQGNAHSGRPSHVLRNVEMPHYAGSTAVNVFYACLDRAEFVLIAQ